MGEHTPGPWALGDDEEYDIIIGNPNESDCILEGHLVGSDPEQRHANAILLTSAPELLEALQELLRALTEQAHDPGISDVRVERAYIGARAAIAKARGQ